MRRGLTMAAALATGVCLISLGGCGGSSAKTVSLGSAPTQSQTASQPPAGTQPTSPATVHTIPPQPSTGGATPAPTSTRTAAAPAFTHPESTAEGLDGAVAVVRAQGFTPNTTSIYHPSQTLRVLVGTRTGSGDGYGQRAFFFVNDRFIGTDSSQPSAKLRVEAQGDTEVTLAYPLYRSGDPLCCPGGGKATVRFQLNNGRLTPLDPIPPASSKNGLSRQ
ncbi:MAG: LppP/LprE family lipoprotein [Actinomycetota bacterium]|nr:LppP/LprE family lipoprotein [Actinomycetota bacterium]